MELREPRKQEVIYGVVYNMPPSSSRRHALIDGNIFNKLKNSFKDSRCEIFIEQLDFYFHYQDDRNDYIIPDIAIVCDWGKNEKHYHGTPRFVVETLSPSTVQRDKTVKREIYQNCGVDEYWLVDPYGNSLEIYYLKNGVYVLEQSYIYEDDKEEEAYNADTKINLRSFPHVEIMLSEIFDL
ncbi:MAG: Uma2 family endonuclease [Lachnospiraceae bacterium]|nr:Uma2 family endonuclease [Lachnospiraceae bacterium]